MRVLLLQSYLGRSEKPIYPLGIAYLGSFIEQRDGNEVRCVDLNVYPEPRSSLQRELSDYQPDLVGVSLRNIDTTQTRDLYYYYQDFKQQIRMIRHIAPNSFICAGGSGFSLFARRIMTDNPDLDFGIYREGEATLGELLDHTDDPARVKGLFYRDKQDICYSGDRERMDLDLLPKIRWNIVDLEPYRTESGSIGMETKRGCCLSCDYCTYPFLDGAIIRKHTMEKIIDSLKNLAGQHGIQSFTFVDSVFNLPRDHAREICERMIAAKLPLKWVGWFSEKGLDHDFIRLCIDAGCIEFSFSPDGYSAETLTALRKNMSPSDIRTTFTKAMEIPDMNISYNFLANPPAQDFFSFCKLFIFMFWTKYRLRHRLKGFCITNLRIEPNTGIYQRAIQEGLIKPDTDLLPERLNELRQLFYTNPKTRYLNLFMKMYTILWTIRARLKKRTGTRD
ncbi:cobalamin-dependent protein [bacterium]|nr:cobalamin-dependent protein [bacterium]